MTTEATKSAPAKKPARKWLLSQNSELKDIGVFNWSLPAFVVKRANGSHFNVCPQAGICASICYARNGSYNFPMTRQRHMKHLEMVLTDLEGWKTAMLAELAHKRYRGGKHVRIHDAGDFFSDEYTAAWLSIAEQVPDVVFYAYTKEVARFKRMVEGKAPSNFRYLFSMGGRQDDLVDKDKDRHADCFPTMEALVAAGYTDQEKSDLEAIYLPTTRIGIVANNIAAFKKRQGSRSFSEMETEVQQKNYDRKRSLAGAA